ncbi:MAG: redoxin domain-containing protein [Chloroflexi bacterium]|nr:redoxin domain-containing protein [Chloroflexota bacterium]
MELQRSLPELAEEGIVPLAVSYDEPAVLAGFARDHGIEYPLLADQGSEVIRRYGILNAEIDPGDEHYGIPVPGSYLVGSDGRVEQKLFHRSHRVREAGAALIRRVGGRAAPDSWPSASSASGEVAVRATLEARCLRVGQVVDLVVRLEPAPGLHLYGRPAPEGLYPTTVTVASTSPLRIGEARYPPTEPYRVRGLGRDLPAFVGEIEIVVPLVSEIPDSTVPIDVEVRYQACSESECLLPRTERLRLNAPARGLVPGRPRPA